VAAGKAFHNKISGSPGMYAVVCLAALFAATSAFAEAPIIEFSGYINGVMSIWATNAVAPVSRVVQMKAADADDSHYADVAFSSTTFKDNKNNVYNVYYLETNWNGLASVRIANVDASSVRTYAYVGDFENSISASPVAFLNSTYPSAYPASNAMDGKIDTFADGSSERDGRMFTADFGERRTITSVRWVHRRFGQILDRTYNAVVECSDDPDFAEGVTTVLTIPSASPAYPGYFKIVHEHVLDAPKTARYFRYKSANGTFGSLAELEFTTSDYETFMEEPSVAYSDITNFYPVVSATPYPSFSSLSSVVQRASNENGPWRDACEWTIGAGAVIYTNTVDAVGPARFYRLRTVCGRADSLSKVVDGPAVRAVRYRRLDRSWGNEATLLPRVVVMPPYSGATSTTEARKAFDGNAGTAPDIYPPGDTRNPAIGLDFGDAGVHIAFVRLLPRNITQGPGRVNMTSLYLCTEEDWSDAVAVARVNGMAENEWRLLPVAPLAAPNRFAWISAPANNGSSSWWYGNVAEFQMFGWTDEDVIKAETSGTTIIFK
jgi:hypothetical protein